MTSVNAHRYKAPETVVGDEGTAKRNILRKNSAGGGGKAKKDGAAHGSCDDGSMYHDGPALDKSDPNYDSEEDQGRPYMPFESALRANVGKSKMTLTTYKQRISTLISEYFVHGLVEETLSSLLELDDEGAAGGYAYEFVKRLINSSFDKQDRERELASQLLSAGYPDCFSSNCIGKGFERLFELLDEIEKDAPQARDMLSLFIARCVADEVLPPSFLTDAVVCNLGGDVVERAKLMLSREHGGAKLEHGWGPGDGRPVSELKVAVDQLLAEYLLSGDAQEAERCIRELNAPLFYHEVVKRAVVTALDATPEQRQMASQLLARLRADETLSAYQATKGFNRLFALLPDLSLDTPAAPALLTEFYERAKADGVLPASYNPPQSSTTK